MRGICIDQHEPAVNLAIEEHLCTTLPQDDAGWFLLWRNAPSIIVGRNQNTAQEVHAALVAQYNLPVVRRMTGGGAVYHDLGNLNYSFIVPQRGGISIDFGTYLWPIVAALQTLGVNAAFTSRNDLTVGGKKISGSAQLRRQGTVLHHGTLMVDVDLDMLDAVLTGNPDKYLSKGVTSVRSRVQNLAEVLPASVDMATLQDTLLRHCADTVVPLPPDALVAAEALAATKYRTWDWNYGASPPFTEKRYARFPWGAVDVWLDVRDGCVQACNIFGDFFAREDVTALAERLHGVRVAPEHLRAALRGVVWDAYFAGCEASVMEQFFVTGQVQAAACVTPADVIQHAK